LGGSEGDARTIEICKVRDITSAECVGFGRQEDDQDGQKQKCMRDSWCECHDCEGKEETVQSMEFIGGPSQRQANLIA